MAETNKTDTKKKTAKTISKEQKEKKEIQDSFHLEQAFGELEEIILKLESDSVPLKESIELYAKGVRLVASCKEELTGIEKEMIVIGEDFKSEDKE